MSKGLVFKVGDVLSARYPSQGFQGRFWNEGDLTAPLSEADLEDKAIKHFDLYSGLAELKKEEPQTYSEIAKQHADRMTPKTGMTAPAVKKVESIPITGIDLDSLNVMQLKKVAREHGVVVPDDVKTKPDLIELLKGKEG